jgi:hypothetical protein
MAEARNAAVQVGQMHLRVPGTSAEFGNRVAAGVGHGLASGIPDSMTRRLGALHVRIHQPLGATDAELSHAIVQALVHALRSSNHA